MSYQVAQHLLDWYDTNGRELPWRGLRDPYAIWVAEVMLQQTQVQMVKPYYRRWLDAFPNIGALAAAPIEQVLRIWEGLGYYRRAHNLHQAARHLAERNDGHLPASREQLQQLPGIGRYTSAAIAAIAFDHEVIAVDGNIRRVMARLFDLSSEVKSAHATTRLERMGELLMPPHTAARFNQALMDLGATVCTPAAPDCPSCPLQPHCRAAARGTQSLRPAAASGKSLPWVVRLSVALVHADRVLLRRRPDGGLLAGLWEFPGVDLEARPAIANNGASAGQLGRRLQLDLTNAHKLGTTRHAYTHFRHLVHAWLSHQSAASAAISMEGETAWVPIKALAIRPMGKIDRWIAGKLAEAIAAEDRQG